MSLSSSKFTFSHALMNKDFSIGLRLRVPLVSRPQTEEVFRRNFTKAYAGAEITSCATSGTAAHWGLATSFCCQYWAAVPWTGSCKISLSCTGSGSFWHWLYCSMSCFLELVPLCPSALLPDAEIVGQELNRYQHQQEGICSEIICTFKHKLS